MKNTAYLATLALLAAPAWAQVSWDDNPTPDPALQQQVDTMVRQEAPMAATTPVETVDVRLPSGQVVQVPNSADAPWYKSEMLGGVKNFYYDPETSSYVVYASPAWENRLKDRWDATGAPTGRYIPAKNETAADRAPSATDEVAPVVEGDPSPAPLAPNLDETADE